MKTKLVLLMAWLFAAAPACASDGGNGTLPPGLRAALHETLGRDSHRTDAAPDRSVEPAGTPSWTRQDAVASDGAWDDRFGNSVAVAGDVAVVGAFDAKVGDNYQQGAVYVFTRQDGVWTQAQKLLAGDGAGMANFGTAVALAGDALLVSAPNANINGAATQGAVYVFTHSDSGWTQTQKLVASDGRSGDSFGNAIATSGDTALVAAKVASVGGVTLQGKVYAFTRAGSTWTEAQILSASDGASNDLFGSAVAIDGHTAIIGAPTFPYNFAHGGRAYVFARSDAGWTQTQSLTSSASAVADLFGTAVAVDGDVAIVSSIGNQFAHGTAFVFQRAAGDWTQAQQIGPDDGAAGDEFGIALALSGSTAIIGADRLVIDGHQGAAYVFTATDGAWAQSDEFTEASGTSLDFFGSAIAFDGATALVGTPGATVGDASFQGTASFFTSSAPSLPAIVVDPASLHFEATVGSTATQVLTIADTGTADLVWSVRSVDGTDPAGCAATTPAAWLRTDATDGTTPPGSTATLQVSADADGLEPGEHDALLCITSNDVKYGIVAVPVSVLVGDDDVIFKDGFEG